MGVDADVLGGILARGIHEQSRIPTGSNSVRENFNGLEY